MGKYLKLFQTHTQYEQYITGETAVLPNVSHCIQEAEVHYNPIVTETRLIVNYSVTDASEPTKLYDYYDGEVTAALLFDKVEIDGTEVNISDLDTAQGQYQLASGTHTVKYTLKDPTSIDNYTFNGCSSLSSVIIPNSVTSISYGALQNCGLTSITIPNSVTSIGNGAFAYCEGLTSIIIPNSVTTISEESFYGCSSLSSVTIGSGVTSIGNAAFANCSSLITITSYIMTAPSIWIGTFNQIRNNGTIYVPIGSSGYETWMSSESNLGLHNWTKVEQ